MAVKYPITLSVSEPNNNIGLLKVRQADEETQTLVVQILEDAISKSYEGLQAFFCARIGQTAGLGIIEQKLTEAEMTDPKNGKLEYTFRAEDWQILGRQTGYFSFRKMKDDHTYEQQFSTRDFTYEVTKNIYSDGIKEIKKDGSTYVWTIEDLKRLYEEYIASGKSDWEDFVEQNKEIIESVDPSGQVLSELIRSRKPEGVAAAYKDLPTRLDLQFGLNSEFREIDEGASFMQRVYNDALEQGVKASWFGAKGDNVSDDTLALQQAIFAAAEGNRVVVLRAEARYVIKKPLILPETVPVIFMSSIRSVIRAEAEMEHMIFKGRESRLEGISFVNVMLDGNHLADYCINLESSTDSFFDRVWINRAKVAGIVFGYDGAGSAISNGATFRRVRITGAYNTEDPSSMSDYGILLKEGASDHHLDDIVVRNVKYAGIKDLSGNNVYKKIHVFGFPEPDFAPEYALDLAAGKSMVSSLFSDGVKKAGIKMRRGGSTIVGCYFFWRTDADWDKSGACGIEIDDEAKNYTILGNVTFGKVGTDIKFNGGRSGVVFGNTCIDVTNQSKSHIYSQDVDFGRDVLVGQDLSVLRNIKAKQITTEKL
ncbi:MAG TPA: hypothetical protein DEQ24_11800, partial [Enterococcus sp.]|nr:hypothetical protein [Enterococcus sp.]